MRHSEYDVEFGKLSRTMNEQLRELQHMKGHRHRGAGVCVAVMRRRVEKVGQRVKQLCLDLDLQPARIDLGLEQPGLLGQLRVEMMEVHVSERATGTLQLNKTEGWN